MFGRDDNKVRVSNAQITTFIGADTTIEGKVITTSSVRIDGTVIGGVIAEGTVVLSESGQIQGNVMAENMVVSGIVDGNMEIRDKVNIEPTGEVYGDITTCKILIDEESIFQGKCNMNRDKEKEKKRRRIRKEEKSVVYEEEAVKDPVIYEEEDAEETVIIPEEELKINKGAKGAKGMKGRRKNLASEVIEDAPAINNVEEADDLEDDQELVTIDISE